MVRRGRDVDARSLEPDSDPRQSEDDHRRGESNPAELPTETGQLTLKSFGELRAFRARQLGLSFEHEEKTVNG